MLALFCWNVTASYAQDGTNKRGFQPGNSYALGDFETINTTNGNVMMHFPLGSLPAGRGGLSAGINLIYSSKQYESQIAFFRDMSQPCRFGGPDEDNETIACTYYKKSLLNFSNNGGWRYAFGYGLELTDRREQYSGVSEEDLPRCRNSFGGIESGYYEMTYVHKLKMIFPDGSSHEMRPSGFNDGNGADALADYFDVRPDGYRENCGGNPYWYTGTMVYYSTDGSYLRLEVQHDGDQDWGNNPWTLYLPDGTRVTSSPTAPQRIYDRNNNYIEIGLFDTPAGPTTEIKDQLNRSVSFGYDAGTGEDTITSQGFGETLTWKVRWKTINVNKHYWPCDSLSCPNQVTQQEAYGGGIPVVDRITLPAQAGALHYDLSYNAPDLPAPSSTGWGELSGVTLPSLAQANYHYAQDGDSTNTYTSDVLRNSPTSKQLTYNQEYDGGANQVTETWGYSTSTSGSSITSPDGGVSSESFNDTTSSFWDSGLAYVSTRPDGSKVERLWARNNLASYTGIFRGDNPYVKTDFTSIKNAAGSYVKTAIKDYNYDKNGNVTRVAEYDWVDYASVPRDSGGKPTGIPNGAIPARVATNNYYAATADASQTTTNGYVYWFQSSPLWKNAIASSELSDGSGNVRSRTELTYDNPFSTGNLTQKTSWDSTKGAYSNPLTSGNSVSVSMQYNQYGSPTLTTDARGTQTLLTYGPVGGVSDLYPTQIQTAYGTSVQRTETRVYDFLTGLVTSATDADNNVTTSSTYDVFGRPTLVQAAVGKPEETRISTEYSDANRRVIVRSDLNTLGDGKLVKIEHYDQLGRVRLSRQLEDSTTQSATDETIGIKAQTRYLFSGSNSYTLSSNPYRAAYSFQESDVTMGWTRSKSDNTGRMVEVQTFGGSGLPAPWASNAYSTGTVSTAYDANFTTVTDQAGKMRRSMTNGLGQLVRVDEPGDPNTNNSLGTTDSPAQPTSYVYDALGNLVTVNQGSQTRSFAYSSIARLLTATNPESGTLSYQYDNNGNLTQKTDARGVVSSYGYDALNRNTTVNYSDGTPAIARYYDGAVNGKGRLWLTYQGGSHTAIDAYDPLGRPTVQRQHFYANGSWSAGFVTQAAYNLAGRVLTQNYPSVRSVTNTYDNAGRLNSFTGNLGDGTTRAYATGISYDSASHWTREQFGTTTPLLYNKRHYNNREQLYDMRLSTVNDDGDGNRGAIVNYYSLANFWGVGATGTDTNGNLYAQQHWVPDGQGGWTIHQQNYDYDSLNRLRWMAEYLNASQNTGGQSYSYDRYGNRTVSGTGTGINNQQFSVDTNTNRLGVPSGQSGTMTYDPAGNLITDTYSGEGTRTYDAENRMKLAWANSQWQTYTYDGDGRRVKRNVDGIETWQVYGLGGELLAEYAANAAASTPQKEYGYRNGELLITATSASSSQGCGVGYGGTKTWSATSGSLGHVVGHAEGSDWAVYTGSDSANFMSYGPYDTSFGQGHHTAQFTLMVDNTSGTDVVANLDVVTGYGGNVLAQRQIHRNEFAAANQWQVFTLEFDNPCFGLLEARLYWYGSVNMKFHQLSVSAVNTGAVDIEWLVTDQLGTPRMIADQTGSLAAVKRHDYLPFGEELYAGVSSRTTQQGYTGDSVRQKFTQKERDNETGLDYFLARYYSSNQGRFVSVDPLAGHTYDPQTLNRYVYTRNSPLINVDPDGLDFQIKGQGDYCKEKGRCDKDGFVVDDKGKRVTVKNDQINVGGNRLCGLCGRDPGYKAVVNEAGVQITNAQGQTFTGAFTENQITLPGADKLKDFTFNITGSGKGVLALGTFEYHGTNEETRRVLSERGAFSYLLDSINRFHPGTDQFRFANQPPLMLGIMDNVGSIQLQTADYGTSSHLSVAQKPKSNVPKTTGEWHVDDSTGLRHLGCAILGRCK
jgi:RHS repeat-associated protein